MAENIEPGWYTLEGAAAYTGLSAQTIKLAASLGRLIVQKVKIGSDRGGRILIRREALDSWIEGKPVGVDVIPRALADELRWVRFELMALRREVENRVTLPPRWLKLRAASKYCGLSDTVLGRAIKAGRIESTMVGGARLIDRISIDAWISNRSVSEMLGE